MHARANSNGRIERGRGRRRGGGGGGDMRAEAWPRGEAMRHLHNDRGGGSIDGTHPEAKPDSN